MSQVALRNGVSSCLHSHPLRLPSPFRLHALLQLPHDLAQSRSVSYLSANNPNDASSDVGLWPPPGVFATKFRPPPPAPPFPPQASNPETLVRPNGPSGRLRRSAKQSARQSAKRPARIHFRLRKSFGVPRSFVLSKHSSDSTLSPLKQNPTPPSARNADTLRSSKQNSVQSHQVDHKRAPSQTRSSSRVRRTLISREKSRTLREPVKLIRKYYRLPIYKISGQSTREITRGDRAVARRPRRIRVRHINAVLKLARAVPSSRYRGRLPVAPRIARQSRRQTVPASRVRRVNSATPITSPPIQEGSQEQVHELHSESDITGFLSFPAAPRQQIPEQHPEPDASSHAIQQAASTFSVRRGLRRSRSLLGQPLDAPICRHLSFPHQPDSQASRPALENTAFSPVSVLPVARPSLESSSDTFNPIFPFNPPGSTILPTFAVPQENFPDQLTAENSSKLLEASSEVSKPLSRASKTLSKAPSFSSNDFKFLSDAPKSWTCLTPTSTSLGAQPPSTASDSSNAPTSISTSPASSKTSESATFSAFASSPFQQTSPLKPRTKVKVADYLLPSKNYKMLSNRDFDLEELDGDLPLIPRLAHGLDRALFNPGLNQLRDLKTRVYNFDPGLEKLPAIQDINYDTLAPFTPPSQDSYLARLCSEHSKKYAGSTSSLTGLFTHFHYLLSAWRPISLPNTKLPQGRLGHQPNSRLRMPASVFLRWKDGFYAIDASSVDDRGNALSLVGRYLEPFLTKNMQSFQYHSNASPDPPDPVEKSDKSAYHYSAIGDILIRSQLDAYDPRLPGTGVFDLKTRAVLPIRMSRDDFRRGLGYELSRVHGSEMSFEREYEDIARSALLKYSLQARMGRMDGIFLAYHNIDRLFGFQYLSMSDMDTHLHGQSHPGLGHAELMYSGRLLNAVLDRATQRFPQQSLRITLKTTFSTTPYMKIVVRAIREEQIDALQSHLRQRANDWEQVVKETGAPPPSTSSQELMIPEEMNEDQEMNEDREMNEDQELTSSPRLVMVLKTRSVVGSKKTNRPKGLELPQRWKLSYELVTIQSNLEWSHQGQSVSKAIRTASSPAMKPAFQRQLDDMVRRSKRWRVKRDAQDTAEEKKMGGVFLWNSDLPVKREELLNV